MVGVQNDRTWSASVQNGCNSSADPLRHQNIKRDVCKCKIDEVAHWRVPPERWLGGGYGMELYFDSDECANGDASGAILPTRAQMSSAANEPTVTRANSKLAELHGGAYL